MIFSLIPQRYIIIIIILNIIFSVFTLIFFIKGRNVKDIIDFNFNIINERII